MTTFSSRRVNSARAGFTLLEIILVVGLSAILALVSVPAMSGWWSEHQLKEKANELIGAVQSAKLQAERSGTPQMIIVLKDGEKPPISTAGGASYLREGDGYEWAIWKFGSKKPVRQISVDERGQLTPVTCELRHGEQFVRYQIDFLTGHAREESSSF